jgi:hypothetical protein
MDFIVLILMKVWAMKRHFLLLFVSFFSVVRSMKNTAVMTAQVAGENSSDQESFKKDDNGFYNCCRCGFTNRRKSSMIRHCTTTLHTEEMMATSSSSKQQPLLVSRLKNSRSLPHLEPRGGKREWSDYQLSNPLPIIVNESKKRPRIDDEKNPLKRSSDNFYHCNICGLKATRKIDMRKHIESKRHKKKSDELDRLVILP